MNPLSLLAPKDRSKQERQTFSEAAADEIPSTNIRDLGQPRDPNNPYGSSGNWRSFIEAHDPRDLLGLEYSAQIIPEDNGDFTVRWTIPDYFNDWQRDARYRNRQQAEEELERIIGRFNRAEMRRGNFNEEFKTVRRDRPLNMFSDEMIDPTTGQPIIEATVNRTPRRGK